MPIKEFGETGADINTKPRAFILIFGRAEVRQYQPEARHKPAPQVKPAPKAGSSR